MLETIATGAARGFGDIVVGPLVAASLDSREVRASVLHIALTLGASIGAGVALGIVVGHALKPKDR